MLARPRLEIQDKPASSRTRASLELPDRNGFKPWGTGSGVILAGSLRLAALPRPRLDARAGS